MDKKLEELKAKRENLTSGLWADEPKKSSEKEKEERKEERREERRKDWKKPKSSKSSKDSRDSRRDRDYDRRKSDRGYRPK